MAPLPRRAITSVVESPVALHSLRQPALRCPVHGGDGKTDDQVLDEVYAWLRQKLPCVAGRREFNRDRYMIEIASASTVKATLMEFTRAVSAHRRTACLMLFNEPAHYAGRSSAAAAFRFLADQMAGITHKRPQDLAGGHALTTTLSLPCPVTGVLTEFDDFECVAFCPQSSDPDDPLYDPLMYAPYPAVNMASDVFGFSMFVAESCQTKYGVAPYALKDLAQLEALFAHAVARWHKIAQSTIANFAALTDTRKCPVHVTPDGLHWVAAHKDPAFAEAEKIPHRHELPAIYARRICDEWLAHFAMARPYRAAGLAREGLLQ